MLKLYEEFSRFDAKWLNLGYLMWNMKNYQQKLLQQTKSPFLLRIKEQFLNWSTCTVFDLKCQSGPWTVNCNPICWIDFDIGLCWLAGKKLCDFCLPYSAILSFIIKATRPIRSIDTNTINIFSYSENGNPNCVICEILNSNSKTLLYILCFVVTSTYST